MLGVLPCHPFPTLIIQTLALRRSDSISARRGVGITWEIAWLFDQLQVLGIPDGSAWSAPVRRLKAEPGGHVRRLVLTIRSGAS